MRTLPNILSENFIKMSDFFKENLIFLRELKNETQSDTALVLGLSRSTYANYEAGENLPKADTMMKIIGHFGVSFEKIMSENLKMGKDNETAKKQKSSSKGKDSGKDSGRDSAPNSDSEPENEYLPVGNFHKTGGDFSGILIQQLLEDRKALIEATNAAKEAALVAKEALITANSVIKRLEALPATPAAFQESLLESLLLLGYKPETERLIEAHRAGIKKEKSH